MELDRSVTVTHSPKRATKAVTVSALSLKKKNYVSDVKTDEFQGLMTRSRFSKHKKEKRPDNSFIVRQTCRCIKLKKCEDFVYGNTKVTTYKQKKNSAPVTNNHKLKSLSQKKFKPVDAYNQDIGQVAKGRHGCCRSKKVKTEVKKGGTRLKEVRLISEESESILDNSEACVRKRLKRKLAADDESEEKANEIAAKKSLKNTGKVAKQNENHLKNESLVRKDNATDNKGKLYSRQHNKSKINKQKNRNKSANKVKSKTSERNVENCKSEMPPTLVGTSRTDELDMGKEKCEIATNAEDVRSEKNTIREVKEQDDIQKEGINEIHAGSETRAKSTRKVKKKVDEDFEYYESDKLKIKSLEDDKHNQNHKKNLEKSINEENVNNTENSPNLESIEPNHENVNDNPDVNIGDEEPSNEDTDIKCVVCNLSFPERESYVKHIREVHKTLILCEYCNGCVETKTEMWKHLKESHKDITVKEGKYKPHILKCTFENCSLEFTREKSRQRHINRFHLKIHYQCEICGIRYKQIESLKSHLKVQHEIDVPITQLDKFAVESKASYKCPYDECSKKFNHTSNFKKHIDAVHLNLRNFQCEFCEQRFKTSSSLKLHIAARHTKDDDKKLYECDVCQKTFLRKGSLQLHQSLHTNAKNYSCSFDGCGKLFRLKSNLTKHEKIHNDVKPHQCDVCGERFSRKTYLETHMYKHTGVKDYSCDICQKSFSQKGNLRTHKLLHNRERPIYKCPKCSQSFNFKSNMKKHLERHSTHLDMNRMMNNHFEDTEIEGRVSKCVGNSPPQICSDDTEKDLETVKTKANVIDLGTVHKGNFGAFKPNKIWITPNVLNTLQNGAKAVVLVMNPKNSPEEKLQGKDIERVKTVTEDNTVGKITKENDKGSSGYCSILKPPQNRFVVCSIGQKPNVDQVDSVNDILDRPEAEPETVAVPSNVQSFNSTEEHRNDISVGQGTSNPVYVCIEDVTHQLSMASKAEKNMSNFPKSGVKSRVLAEKNPSFTIEFDSNGIPIAKLKDSAQVSVSKSSCEVLNSQQTSNEIDESEYIFNDNVKVTNETAESVETTGELIAINDTLLKFSAENPVKVFEREHVSNLLRAETETASSIIDQHCYNGDVQEISCQNLNTDFQDIVNIESLTVTHTSSYSQNVPSLLNHDTHYSAGGNTSVPFSARDTFNSVKLRYPLSNPQAAESEIFNHSDTIGDAMSNTEERNELQISGNSDLAVKTDLVVTEVNDLIVAKDTDEETPVENF